MRASPERLRDHREYPILYVDDEPENLRIFELTFRREFSIVTATSGEQGLEILRERPIALVLSDHRMPGMTGTDFLAKVAELDPSTIRIMVTAYGDVETLQTAINTGSIYRFIPKPWTPEDVRATLRRGIEAYALVREREQLLRELTILNRMSHTLTRELDLDRLLHLLLEALVEEMQYDAAGLLLFDPKEQVLRVERMCPFDDPVEGALRRIRISDESAPRFLARLREGRAHTLQIGGALDYEGPIRELVTEVAAEEIVVSPLHGKEGLIGALTIDNRRGGRRFTMDDRTLIEGLSNQAAIAIENARLVDDLRRSREQVRRVDRLGTLGTLAAGLAHEINNPLVSIHTFLSMAPEKRSEPDDDFWGDYHALACREVDRIRGLVDTMQRLGRGGASTAPRTQIDLATIAREAVTLLEREAELGEVTLRCECETGGARIRAAADQMHQVVLNLLPNAIAATPPGGEVRVRVVAAEAGVRLDVSDTGPGIAAEHVEMVFDPFFTTKGPDQGTGLGLMVCHRIVTDHGGSIEVRSREGEGATFSVWLPDSEGQVGGEAGPVA
jgi:signal transduction histidine kinase/CheY-like chemotaxis protein